MERVNRARDRQLERYKDRRGMYCNAQLSSKDIRRYCEIDISCDELLRAAISKFFSFSIISQVNVQSYKPFCAFKA